MEGIGNGSGRRREKSEERVILKCTERTKTTERTKEKKSKREREKERKKGGDS
jgi:hypothetical protein